MLLIDYEVYSMIYLKNVQEIRNIEYVNKLGAELLQICYEYLKPGIVTLELDEIVNKFCADRKVTPSFKNYRGFPHNLCVSVNEEIIHGFPNERVVKAGDIVSVDLGLNWHNYYSDAAFTKIIGKVTNSTKKLVKTTRECLYKGISKAKHGNRLNDISAAVQLHAELKGFDVVREYVGHGVGLAVHEDPKIPNYVSHGINWRLRTGMVIAIEPIVVEGSYEVCVGKNNWTVTTKDNKLSSHFEHSLAITDDKPIILSEI